MRRILLVGLIAAGGIGLALAILSMGEPSMIAFDSKTWQDQEQVHQKPYPRRGMADNLLQERALHGKTREQVAQMLGEPTNTEYFADYDVVYWLGPQRGFLAVDSEWLVIRFDDSDRVTEYEIKTD